MKVKRKYKTFRVQICIKGFKNTAEKNYNYS